MTYRNFIKTLLLVGCTFIIACGPIEEKARQIEVKVKLKGKQLIARSVSKISQDEQPANVSIRSLVKDFQKDKSVTEIKGIQTDYNWFYVEYFVYTGRKDRVLSGVNKIIVPKGSSSLFNQNCVRTTREQFYETVAANEKNRRTAFFWTFEKPKEYEVYTCIKGLSRHHIVFDNKSDTVYHRIDEFSE